MAGKFKVAIISTLAMAAFGLMAGGYLSMTGQAEADSRDKMLSDSNVYRFADASVVEGASSTLARTKNGITATIQTDDLKAGNAYTLWWVIFNNPEKCEHAIPGMSNCGEGDVFGQPLGQTSVDARSCMSG